MSDDGANGSVTGWIARLKHGDPAAAQQILERYFDQIVSIARRRIGGGRLDIADEEDIAIEAFESLFKAVDAGRLGSLHHREELWKLLVATACRRVCDYWRRQVAQKRGGKGTDTASDVPDATELPRQVGAGRPVADRRAAADLIAAIADQHQFLMKILETQGNSLPETATMILHGYTNREIAEQLLCSERRIERKRQLIRDLWQHAIGEHA